LAKKKPISRDRDYFCSSGAMALAQAIERYWWDRGHHEVMTWIEDIPASVPIGVREVVKRGVGRPRDDHKERYAIRSNLVNGLPPRMAWKNAA
jgi:hypothetical protein